MSHTSLKLTAQPVLNGVVRIFIRGGAKHFAYIGSLVLCRNSFTSEFEPSCPIVSSIPPIACRAASETRSLYAADTEVASDKIWASKAVAR